ncbi:histidine kinase, partial [Clostridioides difficile]|nr:histidine kinase [Clostridioides difficile]
ASDMVQSFARLMRYSIYYGSTIVSLRTDIEYINDYLLLQKMRYNRRLKYHIDIPEEVLEYRIPKLLLQPVVENSLVHGMKNTHSISITITGRV